MNEKKFYCHRLHAWAFGFAAAILWAVVVFILAIVNVAGVTYGANFIASLSTMYLGYGPSFVGAIVGAIWAFFDAGIGFLIFAWLYNCFTRCCCKKENTE